MKFAVLNFLTLFFLLFLPLANATTEEVFLDEEVFAPPKKPNPRAPKPPSTAPKDFFLVTIPKAGTHLNTKLLTMLTGREPCNIMTVVGEGNIPSYKQFDAIFFNCKQNNLFPYHHLGGLKNDLFTHFKKNHPEYVKLLAIRDLRDVFVSLVYFYDKEYSHMWTAYGLPIDAPFDQKLALAISKFIKTDIISALCWYQDPDTVVLRYEEIVGVQGGGDANAQRKAVTYLANSLNIYLTDSMMVNIVNNLFGVSSGPQGLSTFFTGKIGKWKSTFNDENKKLFNKHWGVYQQAFGYPLAE